jgi:hypothetical protein
MSTKKALAGLAASSLLVFLVAAPAYAEDIPEMEKPESAVAAPPPAVTGADKPIPEMEKPESGGPNVKPGATGADKPIEEMEKPD